MTQARGIQPMGPPLDVERPHNDERTNMTPPPSPSQRSHETRPQDTTNGKGLATQTKGGRRGRYFKTEGYKIWQVRTNEPLHTQKYFRDERGELYRYFACGTNGQLYEYFPRVHGEELILSDQFDSLRTCDPAENYFEGSSNYNAPNEHSHSGSS
uniref:Uncharacterized protein n=1 Tax=Cannabis sativa TaxID=3483 RepID=A0A803P6G1_CANSA